MKKPQWLFAALFLCLTPAFLQAQMVQNDKEKTSDRSLIHQDDAQLAQDVRELSTMSLYRDRIVEAFSINDLSSVQAMKSDILKAMQVEINQSKSKPGQVQTAISQHQEEIYQNFLAYEFALNADGKAKLELVNDFIDLMEKDKALTEAEMSKE